MENFKTRCQPGRVRDAIIKVLSFSSRPLHVKEIEESVNQLLGPTSPSSIRSYLRLNTPELFLHESYGTYSLRPQQTMLFPLEAKKGLSEWLPAVTYKNATLYHADCFEWIKEQSDLNFHAVLTDPPYGLFEYTKEQQDKLRNGKGGVWRIPPSFDGHQRSPLPRFTTLSEDQLDQIRTFFILWAQLLFPKIVPGAHIIVASNPLLSFILSGALADGGLERRGEIIRLTMTMRGGDRPKAAHDEFPEISVMPRSMWEPWVVFRKPIEGRVQDNLRKWKTGGFRRPSKDKPFGDVIESGPTRKNERAVAPHPSLKPQSFMRKVVRAILPMGEGIILDPFAGAGSTLAAAEAVGYQSIGVEKDKAYFQMASQAIPKLARINTNENS